MIAVRNLSKSYGDTTAVTGISFEVAAGEHLVLLGTSGCGKTTTLKMINLLIEPTSGTIEVDGINVRDQQPELLRRRIGYVLQRNSLFPHFSVAENIAVVPKLLNWEASKIASRTRELLAKLHLSDRQLGMYPTQLSGGEAQRVNLARALVADPPILLMDEPFSALDPITRASIRREFKALDEFKKKTIILVTHDVQEAFELGDRICLMNEGRIMQLGTPAELLFRPANDFVRAFLADAFVQLALGVTRLDDIWQWLDDEGDAVESHNAVSSTATIADALAVFEDKNAQTETLLVQKISGERKQVGWQGLLRAFGNHKPAAK
jgi:osmoprotectant transport system ATP-binding protein